MRTIVTGASGFVGRHVVPALLDSGHEVLALGRDPGVFAQYSWGERVRSLQWDIETGAEPLLHYDADDVLVHMAWAALDDFRSPRHTEQILPAHQRFLASQIEAGLSQVVITGTCLEYGLAEGCLSEDREARPHLAYAEAKHRLHDYLRQLPAPPVLRWLRLFYLHGEGQSPRALLPSLQRALDAGDSVFPMSGGEQRRDYLPIETAARHIAALAAKDDFSGTVNVCSGEPITVRALVEDYLQSRGKSIELQLGHYPYPDYEAMAFWGDTRLLSELIGETT